jgi:hypothetical protein
MSSRLDCHDRNPWDSDGKAHLFTSRGMTPGTGRWAGIPGFVRPEGSKKSIGDARIPFRDKPLGSLLAKQAQNIQEKVTIEYISFYRKLIL